MYLVRKYYVFTVGLSSLISVYCLEAEEPLLRVDMVMQIAISFPHMIDSFPQIYSKCDVDVFVKKVICLFKILRNNSLL